MSLFKRKLKVTFYMKSGNSFMIKFDEFEISKLSESAQEGVNRTMTYSGQDKQFTVDVNEIECCIIDR